MSFSNPDPDPDPDPTLGYGPHDSVRLYNVIRWTIRGILLLPFSNDLGPESYNPRIDCLRQWMRSSSLTDMERSALALEAGVLAKVCKAMYDEAR